MKTAIAFGALFVLPFFISSLQASAPAFDVNTPSGKRSKKVRTTDSGIFSLVIWHL